MTLGDRIGAAAEGVVGRAKQAVGRAVGDGTLEEEGRVDEAAARLKQDGEDLSEPPR